MHPAHVTIPINRIKANPKNARTHSKRQIRKIAASMREFGFAAPILIDEQDGQDGKSPFVVLSVGGFLGMGTKLVVLPYEQLRTTGGKVVLPGATKDALKDLPEFKYASG